MELLPSLSIIRDRAGLTQAEFAEKMGISRPHLSKLENTHGPLSPKLNRKVTELCKAIGLTLGASESNIRSIPIKSWAQAGVALDAEELPLDWQKYMATDCPDQGAFAVEIQGDSMEPKYFQGDLAILMPEHQPRNGSLVVARLEDEGVVCKIFTARVHAGIKTCSFTSYNPVYQPIEVPEKKLVWNFPVYQIIRQVWR